MCRSPLQQTLTQTLRYCLRATVTPGQLTTSMGERSNASSMESMSGPAASQVFISLVDELATDRCRDAWDLGYVRQPAIRGRHRKAIAEHP